MKKDIHWADFTATEIIEKRGKKAKYVCAAGITPSGTIHIGNFREMITVDLICRALKDKKKKVHFIYSWDDYDRLRKVPKNMPKQELLQKNIGKPITIVPDTFECHKSYAEHLEKEIEIELPKVGIYPEFIYQYKKYKKGDYTKEIKFVLDNKEEIRKILDKYRKEPLPQTWIPLGVYCKKCGYDFTNVLDYDGKWEISYECKCGHSEKVNIRKSGNIKLPWRVDWPMRWVYEKVDFEPGGKEHSTPGGSRTTAKEIIEKVFKEKAPIYQMYDFIIVKGQGGKMSSSLGNVITLKDCLEIYEPEIIRHLFVSTRPNKEFAISFDIDVLKVYEDFDYCERIYFNKEKIKNKKESDKQKRIYELSGIKIPKKYEEKPSFRHLTVLTQIYEGNIRKVVEELKSKKIETRARCAYNWIQKYAPEDMKFKLHEKISKEINSKLTEEQKKALKLLENRLKQKKFNQKTLFNEFYKICEEVKIKNTDFFKGVYLTLIGKERGPKLAPFILTIGKKRILDLLKQVK